MNQILLTNNYNNSNKKNKDNSSNIRNIIIFSSVAIIIFALVMIGVYVYKISKNNNKEQEITMPELTLEETDSQVTIIAKSSVGISKIIYVWNNEEPVEMNMNGVVDYQEQMDIPEGDSTLNVKVIDLNNQEIESNHSFTKEITNKPTIETVIGEDARLKITATATEGTAMAYLTYKWNDEEETTVNAANETDAVIEATIDVKRGENILTVTAVNTEGKSEKIEKKFNGVNNPIIEVTKSGSKLNMKISHDMGFEKIEFYLNGQIYTYDENYAGYDSTKKELEYILDLQEGENIIIIVATSTEGTQATYQGKCEYTAE